MNDLKGSIPESLLEEPKNANNVQLDHNRLSGPMPASLCRIRALSAACEETESTVCELGSLLESRLRKIHFCENV